MTCTKITFDSRQDAKRRAGKSPGLRPYACSRCGHYHLTSKSARQIKQNFAAAKVRRQAALDARWAADQARRQLAIDTWDERVGVP